jgi:hypothetical protein
MYPNPQEVLPLTPRPNLEQYRKLAKNLVKACRSSDADAVRVWANTWVEQLARRWPGLKTLNTPSDVEAHAGRIAEFTRTQLPSAPRPCALTTAQFVIARAHGFLSWPKFVRHLESLGRAHSLVAAFERAVSAVVTGEATALKRLLREHPALARTESNREHRATLLHYVTANGVEGYHQVSPKNSAEIPEILLDAGASVDATSDVYQGKCTPLGLVATSSPPFAAGVQREVIDVLLAHGAPWTLGDRSDTTPHSCTAALRTASRRPPSIWQAEARLSAWSKRRAFGDLERLQGLAAGAESSKLLEAFSMACAYGRVLVVEFLLDQGVGVNVLLRGFGEGHTGLHSAAYQGHLDVVTSLLRHGARVDVIDRTWRTTPLTWALTGWARLPSPHHHEVVARLVAAGAAVTSEMLEWDKVRADRRMTSALRTPPSA